MRTYLVVGGLTTLIYLSAVGSLAKRFRTLPIAWQLLGYSGVPLALGGLGFVLRFWHPTAGPYVANLIYPFGAHLNAWAVSFGFMWLAFGLLFMFTCLQAGRSETTYAWSVLLLSWLLAWLPHGVIGVAFARFGANRESIDIYTAWASDRAGCVTLLGSALIMVGHFALSISGFILTYRRIMKRRSTNHIPD